jgi:hypothetical protein
MCCVSSSLEMLTAAAPHDADEQTKRKVTVFDER